MLWPYAAILDMAAHSTSNAINSFHHPVTKEMSQISKDKSAIGTSSPLIISSIENPSTTFQSLKSLPFVTFPHLYQIFNWLAI
jgi:hypothetical protein